MSMTKYGAKPEETAKTAAGKPGTKEVPPPKEKPKADK